MQRRIGIALLVGALALTACSSGDDDNTADDDGLAVPQAPGDVTPPTTPAPRPLPGNGPRTYSAVDNLCEHVDLAPFAALATSPIGDSSHEAQDVEGVALKRRCLVAVDDTEPGKDADTVIRVDVGAPAEIYDRPGDAASYYDTEVGLLLGAPTAVAGLGDHATTTFETTTDADGSSVVTYQLLVHHGSLLLVLDVELKKGPALDPGTADEIAVPVQDVAIGLIDAMS